MHMNSKGETLKVQTGDIVKIGNKYYQCRRHMNEIHNCKNYCDLRHMRIKRKQACEEAIMFACSANQECLMLITEEEAKHAINNSIKLWVIELYNKSNHRNI